MADRERRPGTSRTRRTSANGAKTAKRQATPRAPDAQKLFLVRWPDLTAALIGGRDHADVMEKLDELGDPGSCTCVEFDGPVWLELGLPIEFSAPASDGTVDAIELRLPNDLDAVALKATFPNADTASIFADRLMELAFPDVAAVLSARRDGETDDDQARRDLEQAVRRELVPLLQHRWRRGAQRRRARAGDTDAALRELADVTVDPRARKSRR